MSKCPDIKFCSEKWTSNWRASTASELGTVCMSRLGVFHGAIAGSVLAGYAYMNDKELPNHRKEQLLQVKAILIPALLAWCAFLTPMATIVSKGTLLGTFVVLVHGTLHRSPSELRYRYENSRFVD